jgi:hypothetical protein
VCEKLSSLEVPAFISYVNDAFVRLSQYSWVQACTPGPSIRRRPETVKLTTTTPGNTHMRVQSELIGMPFSKIFTGHERYLSQFAALLYNQYADPLPIALGCSQ